MLHIKSFVIVLVMVMAMDSWLYFWGSCFSQIQNKYVLDSFMLSYLITKVMEDYDDHADTVDNHDGSGWGW